MLEYSEIRNEISTVLDELKNAGCIDAKERQEFEKNSDLEKQSLVIGVVGKMKAGKSSLVNATVFGDNVLPTGLDTTTVTLTEVNYGERDYAEVEFMTKQDVDDMKAKAVYSGEDKFLAEKAESAKEILDSLSNGYEKYVGKTKEIKICDLPDYVSREGRYAGLAKTVKIYLNNKNLKGVTIIDTPGFNDPVTSRGETTLTALNRCHVVLFVHNQYGYDQSDKDLLIEQVENAGLSEIVDIFNKIDLTDYPISEWSERLDIYLNDRNYVLKELKEGTNSKELLENAHAFYVSSRMALLGLMSYEKLKEDEDLRYFYGQYEESFDELRRRNFADEAKQQAAFVEYSNINAVIDEINRLSKGGSKYLVEGPLRNLVGLLNKSKGKIQIEINDKKERLKRLRGEVASDKDEIADIGKFFDDILEKIKSSSLKVNLLSRINAAITESRIEREKESSSQFTDTKYSETSFGSRGKIKNNISIYNSFVYGFSGLLRSISMKLKDDLGIAGHEEIASILNSLSSAAYVSLEKRTWVKANLENTIDWLIAGIDVQIMPKTIKAAPDGKMKQYALFRKKFEDDYDDKYLSHNEKDGIFKPFKTNAVDNLDFVREASFKLDELKNGILEDKKKTPEQKEEEIKTLEAEIETAEGKITKIEERITEINEMIEKI